MKKGNGPEERDCGESANPRCRDRRAFLQQGAAAAANLRAVQAIIEAQQAAMIACMAACTVTTTAAVSS